MLFRSVGCAEAEAKAAKETQAATDAAKASKDAAKAATEDPLRRKAVPHERQRCGQRPAPIALPPGLHGRWTPGPPLPRPPLPPSPPFSPPITCGERDTKEWKIGKTSPDTVTCASGAPLGECPDDSTYVETAALCAAANARICTAEELIASVGNSAGGKCKLTKTYLWSNATCDEELGGFFEGSFKYFMKCAMTPNVELDAELLKESMAGWGTDDQLLCELVCTRSNAELRAAKAIFSEAEIGRASCRERV